MNVSYAARTPRSILTVASRGYGHSSVGRISRGIIDYLAAPALRYMGLPAPSPCGGHASCDKPLLEETIAAGKQTIGKIGKIAGGGNNLSWKSECDSSKRRQVFRMMSEGSARRNLFARSDLFFARFERHIP